jgi:hypothetical protein
MSDTTDDNDSVLAQRSLSHMTPAIAMQKVEQETLKTLLQESVIQANPINPGLMQSQSNQTVSNRLSNLKEYCQCMLINYLTASPMDMPKIQKAEDEFFNQKVAERHPELLIDICDYWLQQCRFRIPTKVENSVGSSNKSIYYQNLQRIMQCLQRYKSLVLFDKTSFCKWLSLIRLIPKTKDEQELV